MILSTRVLQKVTTKIKKKREWEAALLEAVMELQPPGRHT